MFFCKEIRAVDADNSCFMRRALRLDVEKPGTGRWRLGQLLWICLEIGWNKHKHHPNFILQLTVTEKVMVENDLNCNAENSLAKKCCRYSKWLKLPPQ